MKILKLALVVLVVAGLGFFAFALTLRENGGCSKEGLMCPDGTTVGREGPTCEFTPCPDVAPVTETPAPKAGTIKGFVKLGPVCPHETIPPKPECAPQGYKTEVRAYNSVTNTLVKTVQSAEDGSFAFSLAYGTYRLEAVGGSRLPWCSPTSLTLKSPLVSGVTVSCDTGLR